MADYEVAVYLTAELQDYGRTNYGDAFRAKDRAETFIDGGFERHGYSVAFLDTTDYSPNPPTEHYEDSFTASCPCNFHFECSYDYLVGWFDDWLDCHGVRAADSTILLSKTDETKGGAAGGSVAHAQTGKVVCALPSSYETHGDSPADNGMNTVFHELGHNLMGATGDEDDDGTGHHDVAALFDRDGEHAITAMEIDGTENDCRETYDASADEWEHTWSNCCVSNWS